MDARDHAGRTPLHLAAAGSHIGVAMVLLSAGADSELRANDGKKPVEMATKQVAALLQAGCRTKADVVALSARGTAALGAKASGEVAAFVTRERIEREELVQHRRAGARVVELAADVRRVSMRNPHAPGSPRVPFRIGRYYGYPPGYKKARELGQY